MKKTVKIIIMLIIAITIITSISPVFAADGLEPGDISATYGDASQLQTTAGKIMGLIRNVAVIASVIILMIVGVKFMLGSTEEKAEYKKSLMPLIIGIVLVVGATSIATFLFNMVG